MVSANLPRPDAAAAPAKPVQNGEADARNAKYQQEDGEEGDAWKMIEVLHHDGRAMEYADRLRTASEPANRYG
jgi:hypothetical protein